MAVVPGRARSKIRLPALGTATAMLAAPPDGSNVGAEAHPKRESNGPASEDDVRCGAPPPHGTGRRATWTRRRLSAGSSREIAIHSFATDVSPRGALARGPRRSRTTSSARSRCRPSAARRRCASELDHRGSGASGSFPAPAAVRSTYTLAASAATGRPHPRRAGRGCRPGRLRRCTARTGRWRRPTARRQPGSHARCRRRRGRWVSAPSPRGEVGTDPSSPRRRTAPSRLPAASRRRTGAGPQGPRRHWSWYRSVAATRRPPWRRRPSDRRTTVGADRREVRSAPDAMTGGRDRRLHRERRRVQPADGARLEATGRRGRELAHPHGSGGNRHLAGSGRGDLAKDLSSQGVDGDDTPAAVCHHDRQIEGAVGAKRGAGQLVDHGQDFDGRVGDRHRRVRGGDRPLVRDLFDGRVRTDSSRCPPSPRRRRRTGPATPHQ